MKINRVKLISEMAQKNIRLYKLCEMSGVSKATLSAVRNGKSCTYETALKIAKALNLNVADLIEESEG